MFGALLATLGISRVIYNFSTNSDKNRGVAPYTQYTPLTQLICRVESHRCQWCVLNSQLAHDACQRLPSKIWKLNMLRIYPVKLSWVVSAVCTHSSAVVTQFTILQLICDWRRKLETGSRLPTGAFTPPTQLNSTVEWRRRCVLGFSVKIC